MSTELPKTFDPADIEARWYAHWEKGGLFRPERPDAEPFTIVNPPPNVTGSLHIGHALDNTLQDIVVRYERLRGKDALWVVGTDHAGIATQMVVERQLEAQQDKRTNYSREDFVKKVWEWKEESGGTITRQLRRLGCSMDWSREQFTMNPEFSRAVTKVFVDLHRKGLIYRDKRLVNWDPKLKTAISDLEVETRDVKGHFWHFRYPLADGVTLDDGRDFIEVATTRPETMLADMAVAVHPDDERYKGVVGKHVILPITGRRVPVVADEHADPELGSGAVKITPGHDFNDFEVGKRAGIAPADMLNMLDAEGNVCQTADGRVPDEFLGLHRFRKDGEDGARELVVRRLKELGCLIPHVAKDKDGNAVEHDAEPRVIATPFGDRGGVVIEPWLTDQWYVDAEKLAQAPIEAVRSGAIEIVPKSWEKTFFNWMENIQPWCVSRQLWWGHRIPAWYDAEGRAYVATSEEEAQAQAGEGVGLTRDPDVLDTWFSSALWPFATLGWPEETDLLAKHYPNDLLISGFDILFFWDARMAMQGMHFLGEAPWKRLYLHGLVRAADGSKMSKSKGNTVDPLGLIDKYGADALRFFMAAMESQGRDIKMDESRVEGYRNFATKLWNAARFCQANGIGGSATIAAPEAKLAVNRWIVGEVVETLALLDKAMADLRFDAAANAIYHFVWDTFCDWYLELIKGQVDEETRTVAGWALDQILVMLHPFMPFITEELWHELAPAGQPRPYELILAKWPAPEAQCDAAAKAEVEWLIDLTRNLRGAKNEVGIAPGAKLEAWLPEPSDVAGKVLSGNAAALERVARLSAVHTRPAPDGAALQVGAGRDALVIPLEGLIDIAAEKARLAKALAAAEKEAKSLEGRLNNANFVERAKPEAVEKARADHAHHTAEAARLKAALERLG
ncbi:valine--tRNA ligase [Altererythrobacter marinus]|uniref:Valine--tRNA ligase n=1 Tax=Pelagerythrobacter marinus TaxID=538382 RepID=A0ABW9V2P8_9SPHN|nr:valine--tRNA ligase [Pelagerythrobacter marinus]MXO69232.1 valine--tRNA ligase [Pelagerythrobacter marinus]